MSDVQLLYLVLALLYAWECLCWLRPGCVAFSTWLGRNWRERQPGTLVGNDKGGFVAAAPLPPLGTLLTANQFPLSCSSEALLSYAATNVNPGPRSTQNLRLVRFDQINEIRAQGKFVVVNGEKFLQLSSTTWAGHLAKHIDQLRKLPATKRESAIATLHREMLDAKAVENRWSELQTLVAPVRLCANMLFVLMFVIGPMAIWRLGFRLSWLGLLIALLMLTTTTAIFFRRAHKKLFPVADDERFTHTLTILLSPLTAARAHDVLSRPVFETFHPLAVAKAFLGKNEFQAMARRVLLDIRHPALPVCAGGDDVACDVENHSRAILQKSVESFLKQSGLNPDDLCRPPLPSDESCSAYCPRCGAQFTSVESQCMDCGGLPVMAFNR